MKIMSMNTFNKAALIICAILTMSTAYAQSSDTPVTLGVFVGPLDYSGEINNHTLWDFDNPDMNLQIGGEVGIYANEYFDFFAESLTMVFAGLSLAAAAYYLAPLFAKVSIRQEDRLAAIISNVDVAEEGAAKPVTNEQISEAWQSSENLVSFEH